MTFRHWTPSWQLQPATTLKVGNPSPSNWQHRYLKVSSLQKSKLQPWGICIYYKTPHSLMIKWYCGGMVWRPLRNLPVCSTLHCAELGHSACSRFHAALTHASSNIDPHLPLNLNRKPYTLFPTLLPYFLSLSLSKCGNGIAHWALGPVALVIIIIIRVVRQWWYLSHFASYLNETWWAHGPWA